MNLHGRDIKVFTGNANAPLANGITEYLGLPIGKSTVETFSDGEISVNIHESVRGSDVFVVQPTSCPADRHLMELLIMIDAFKRASAGRITAVVPYYGYARQDRKSKSRDPITAKLVANLITASGADRVLTMDLHVPQIQGFFDIPVDNLLGMPILFPYIEQKIESNRDEWVLVSPDIGSVPRTRLAAEKLNLPLAIVDKRRQRANVSEVMNIIGEVKGKNIVMFDDIIDTAGTLCHAAEALCQRGAKSVVACATHGVLSGNAISNINNSVMSEVVILDTIRLDESKKSDKLKVLSVAPVFAEAVARTYSDKPISPLFG